MSNHDDCTIYAGPALIAGRGDSDSSGVWVKFSLPAETGEGPHPFRGYSGKAVQLAVVLCDDNGNPQKRFDCVPEKSVEPAKPERAAPSRSNLAAIMCKGNDAFQVWLAEKYPKVWDRFYYHEIGGSDASPATANDTLKTVLGIASKKELDTDPEAAARFDALRTDFELRDMVR